MYSVSNAYKTAIAQSSRTDKIDGKITLTDGTEIPFSDEDLKGGTLTIDNQCVNGDELEFGTVYTGQLSFTVTTDINRYRLFNAVVELSYFLQLAGGTYEEIPLGVYTVSEPTRKGANITMKCYDYMLKFDEAYGGTAEYGTPFEVLTRICELAGVPLKNTAEEIGALCNGEQLIQLDGDSGCSTLRDCVAEVARFLAAFATIDRDGTLKIVQFEKTANTTIEADRRFSTTVSDFVSSYDGIIFAQKAGTVSSFDDEKTDGLVMSADDLPFLDVGLPETVQTMADNIRKVLCAYAYTPSDVSFSGDPALELGDAIEYDVDGTAVLSMVTSFAWKYRAKETLKCVGKNPYIKNQKSGDAKQLDKIKQEVENSASAVASYENIREIKLTKEFKQIANITAVSLKDTSAMFAATVLINVNTDVEQSVEKVDYKLVTDDDGKVTLEKVVTTETVTVPAEQAITFQYRINEDYITDHTPIQTIKTGKYIVTLTYPLPVIDGNVIEQVRLYAMISGGTVTIDAIGLKAAIYGAGLKGAEVWDGTITIDEIVDPIQLGDMDAQTFNAVLNVSQQKPIPNAFTESMPVVTTSGMIVFGVSEQIKIGEITDREVISDTKKLEYVFDARYITTGDGSFRLVTEYKFESAEETIDSGRMAALNIIDDGLTVAGIEVVNNG